MKRSLTLGDPVAVDGPGQQQQSGGYKFLGVARGWRCGPRPGECVGALRPNVIAALGELGQLLDQPEKLWPINAGGAPPPALRC